MAQHEIKLCKHCSKVIYQCRCFDCNKKTTYGVCDDCAKKTSSKEFKIEFEHVNTEILEKLFSVPDYDIPYDGTAEIVVATHEDRTAKGTLLQLGNAMGQRYPIRFTSPIDLEPFDRIAIRVSDGHVLTVLRGDTIIWIDVPNIKNSTHESNNNNTNQSR